MWIASLNDLIIDNPGRKWFLQQNLPASNFLELHVTMSFFLLNAFIFDNLGLEYFLKENRPVLNMLKIYVWRPTSVICSYLI